MRSLRPKLNYRVLRSLQISFVFTFTILIQQLLHYPRAGWTGFAVMMIYGGFDNGTALLRSYHRFLGVLLGLAMAYFLWIFAHINFRLLFFILPMVVFGVFFFASGAYSVPTIFTVTGSVLGFAYFDTQSGLELTFYLIDYFMCTCIGFAIIVVFETLCFKRYELMARFLNDTQINVLQYLNELFVLLQPGKIRPQNWFNACILLSRNLDEMDRLLTNNLFLKKSEQTVGEDFNKFVELSHRIYIDLKALYIATHTEKCKQSAYNLLIEKINRDLQQLQSLINSTEQIISSKDMYAASQ